MTYSSRLETGYIAEIAVEAAMNAGRNIWIDGSLRDMEWHKQWFSSIRVKYPNYKIAIVYVSVSSVDIPIARWNNIPITSTSTSSSSSSSSLLPLQLTLKHRAAKRAAETGRAVPNEDIIDRFEVHDCGTCGA